MFSWYRFPFDCVRDHRKSVAVQTLHESCSVQGHDKKKHCVIVVHIYYWMIYLLFRSDPWIGKETLAVHEDCHTSRANPQTAGGVRGCRWRSQRWFKQQTFVAASGWTESKQHEIRTVSQPQEPSKKLKSVNAITIPNKFVTRNNCGA